MAWMTPAEGTTQCIGFEPNFLPILQRAVDDKMVTWEYTTIFMNVCKAQFTWADCLWEIVERQECIVSIELLKGAPTMEDLTIAVLTGKIRTSKQ